MWVVSPCYVCATLKVLGKKIKHIIDPNTTGPKEVVTIYRAKAVATKANHCLFPSLLFGVWYLSYLQSIWFHYKITN